MKENNNNNLDDLKNEYIFPKYEDIEIKEVFDIFDTNKNGYIEQSEIKEIFSYLKEEISEEEIDEMISLVDKEGNGQINWLDFYEFISGQIPTEEIKRLPRADYLENKNDLNEPKLSKNYDEELMENKFTYNDLKLNKDKDNSNDNKSSDSNNKEKEFDIIDTTKPNKKNNSKKKKDKIKNNKEKIKESDKDKKADNFVEHMLEKRKENTLNKNNKIKLITKEELNKNPKNKVVIVKNNFDPNKVKIIAENKDFLSDSHESKKTNKQKQNINNQNDELLFTSQYNIKFNNNDILNRKKTVNENNLDIDFKNTDTEVKENMKNKISSEMDTDYINNKNRNNEDNEIIIKKLNNNLSENKEFNKEREITNLKKIRENKKVKLIPNKKISNDLKETKLKQIEKKNYSKDDFIFDDKNDIKKINESPKIELDININKKDNEKINYDLNEIPRSNSKLKLNQSNNKNNSSYKVDISDKNIKSKVDIISINKKNDTNNIGNTNLFNKELIPINLNKNNLNQNNPILNKNSSGNSEEKIYKNDLLKNEKQNKQNKEKSQKKKEKQVLEILDYNPFKRENLKKLKNKETKNKQKNKINYFDSVKNLINAENITSSVLEKTLNSNKELINQNISYPQMIKILNIKDTKEAKLFFDKFKTISMYNDDVIPFNDLIIILYSRTNESYSNKLKFEISILEDDESKHITKKNLIHLLELNFYNAKNLNIISEKLAFIISDATSLGNNDNDIFLLQIIQQIIKQKPNYFFPLD